MPYQSLLRLVYSCTYALHRIEGVTCPSGLCHCERLNMCTSMSVLLAVVRGLPAVLYLVNTPTPLSRSCVSGKGRVDRQSVDRESCPSMTLEVQQATTQEGFKHQKRSVVPGLSNFPPHQRSWKMWCYQADQSLSLQSALQWCAVTLLKRWTSGYSVIYSVGHLSMQLQHKFNAQT